MVRTEFAATMFQCVRVLTVLPHCTSLFGGCIIVKTRAGKLEATVESFASLSDVFTNLLDFPAVKLFSPPPISLLDRGKPRARPVVGVCLLALLDEEVRVAICVEHAHFCRVAKFGVNKA